MAGPLRRSINIPAENYLFFGAGSISADESWLMPYESQAAALTAGSEAAAAIHLQRDGVIRRMTMSQTTPTVQPVVYSLEVWDAASASWSPTGVEGEVLVGDRVGEARGTAFIAQAFDFIRIKVNKVPAEPVVSYARVFVELA